MMLTNYRVNGIPDGLLMIGDRYSELEALDRNRFLAETSSVASILDPADGGRIFPIAPPHPGAGGSV